MAREHDVIYLKENQHDNTKERFKFCVSLFPKATKPRVIGDFGCATGEFIYYLNKLYPNDTLLGMDIVPELIERARAEVPTAEFKIGSVEDRSNYSENSCDISFLSGVHSIFDDPTIAFSNVIHWTRPGGMAIFFGLFNPYPVDVFLRVRTQDQPADFREQGWNMISQATVTKYLKGNSKVESFSYHPFHMGIDLAPQEDPLRTWTEMLANGRRQVINGIGLIHHLVALVIQLKG